MLRRLGSKYVSIHDSLLPCENSEKDFSTLIALNFRLINDIKQYVWVVIVCYLYIKKSLDIFKEKGSKVIYGPNMPKFTMIVAFLPWKIEFTRVNFVAQNQKNLTNSFKKMIKLLSLGQFWPFSPKFLANKNSPEKASILSFWVFRILPLNAKIWPMSRFWET